MSERAAALAEQFERAHRDFVATVAGLSDAEWALSCPNEGRTVAALARHVADAYLFEIRAFQALADRRSGDGVSWEDIHRANAEDAAAFERCDRDETVALLESNAARAAAFVRSLSDEQLDVTGVYIVGLPRRSVAEWIERVLVGHVDGHLASIRAVLSEQK